MDLIYLFLPAVILFGIITSYEDVKKGLIRNKWIASALAYSFILLTFLTALSYLPFNMPQIANYVINLMFSFTAGFFIWHMGLWSAGDAKLFLAYSALVPLSVYSNGYIVLFPSLVILINTFVPLFTLLFVKVFLKSGTKEKLRSLKRALNPRMVVMLAITVFGLSWLTEMLFFLTSVPSNFFLNVLLIFFIYSALRRFVPLSFLKVVMAISVLRVIFDYGSMLSLDFLYNFVWLIAAFVLIRVFVIDLSFDVFSVPVFIEKLKPGMVPAETFDKVGGRYKKRRLISFSFISSRKGGEAGNAIGHERLGESDIRTLQKLHGKGEIKDHSIRVYQTVPFAPLMFIGVLLTILLSGNFMSFIYALFG